MAGSRQGSAATTLGLLALAVGLVLVYGAWTNRRPDDLIVGTLDPSRTVRKID